MKNKSAVKETKTFKCDYNSCDYKTNRKSHLNRHIGLIVDKTLHKIVL